MQTTYSDVSLTFLGKRCKMTEPFCPRSLCNDVTEITMLHLLSDEKKFIDDYILSTIYITHFIYALKRMFFSFLKNGAVKLCYWMFCWSLWKKFYHHISNLSDQKHKLTHSVFLPSTLLLLVNLCRAITKQRCMLRVLSRFFDQWKNPLVG